MFESCCLSLLLVMAPPAEAKASSGPVDFAARFGKFEGCFLLKEIGEDFSITYRAPQTRERLGPCSTFKIFNALAALDSGVATGPDMTLKWDGSKHNRKELERDHTLATAIRDSVLWYFQEIARRIGAEKMQTYLDRSDYGNKDQSAGIDKFWLCTSLTISAEEQVSFLDRLYTNRLPFKSAAMEQVRDMIVLRRSGDWVFSGKTGTGCSYDRNDLGWFVGHLKSGNREFVFAANIKGLDARGAIARDAVFAILRDLRLISD